MSASSSYARVVTEDQRLRVLQVLERDPDGSHNENVLRAALGMAGHRRLSGRRIRDLLDWLAEEGLVRLEERAGLMLAHLTGRGEDVALGGSSLPGVAVPRRRR